MKRWLIYAFVGDHELRFFHNSARTAQSAKNKVIRDFQKSWEHTHAGRQISIFHVEIVTSDKTKELAREVIQQRRILAEMRDAVTQQERLLYRLTREMWAFESAEEE